MLRLFFARLLFKLLDLPTPLHREFDKKEIERWLKISMPLRGFRDYIENRDLEILQSLGMPRDRESYLMLLGQRTELGILLSEAKKNFANAEAKSKAQ